MLKRVEHLVNGIHLDHMSFFNSDEFDLSELL
jgi:hypothetical protein